PASPTSAPANTTPPSANSSQSTPCWKPVNRKPSTDTAMGHRTPSSTPTPPAWALPATVLAELRRAARHVPMARRATDAPTRPHLGQLEVVQMELPLGTPLGYQLMRRRRMTQTNS